MKIYNYHPVTLEYVGDSIADVDPLDNTKWLFPAYTTTKQPLSLVDGKTIVFKNNEWLYEDIPVEEPETVSELTYSEKRAAEYPDFRDYLDGVVKGDQAQIQAYIDACNAVKAKYPKGE